ERGDEVLGVEQLPKPLRAHLRQRVLDANAPAEAIHVGLLVWPHDPLEAAVGEGTCSHRHAPCFGSVLLGSAASSRSYAGSVRKSSKRSATLRRSKSSAASRYLPLAKRSAETSPRTRSISSGRIARKSSGVTERPSSSVARCLIHCQTCAREI